MANASTLIRGMTAVKNPEVFTEAVEHGRVPDDHKPAVLVAGRSRATAGTVRRSMPSIEFDRMARLALAIRSPVVFTG